MIIRSAFPALLVALLLACDAKPVPKKSEIHIQIRIKGDGFASPAELDQRNQLEDEITERKIGEVVDAGSGMGVMDLSVEVTDPVKAKEQILRLLSERKLSDRTQVKVVDPK